MEKVTFTKSKYWRVYSTVIWLLILAFCALTWATVYYIVGGFGTFLLAGAIMGFFVLLPVLSGIRNKFFPREDLW